MQISEFRKKIRAAKTIGDTNVLMSVLERDDMDPTGQLFLEIQTKRKEIAPTPWHRSPYDTPREEIKEPEMTVIGEAFRRGPTRSPAGD